MRSSIFLGDKARLINEVDFTVKQKFGCLESW